MEVAGTATAKVMRVRMRTIVSVVAGALALVAGVPGVADGHPALRCHDTDDTAIDVPHHVAAVTGRYSVPRRPPEALVVVFHGYGHTARDWDERLRAFAHELGVVAVAMDYPGTDETHTWQVQEGADASVDAARSFAARCKLDTVVAYGVSMGGNSSGLAVADTAGLFDWWLDIEGAANVIETYFEARTLAPAVAYARQAYDGIRLEMGGDYEDEGARPNYERRAIVNRVEDVVASGIGGVVMVHAVNDGLVPYNQSRELAALLRYRGMRVDFTTVGRHDRGNAGTTIDGYVPHGQPSPLAGHATEVDVEHLVNRIAFERLRAVLRGEVPPNRDEVVSYPPS